MSTNDLSSGPPQDPFAGSMALHGVAPDDFNGPMPNVVKAIPMREGVPIQAGPPVIGHCYFCGDPINELAGDPGQWPLMFCHADDPGKAKPHHVECVTKRLAVAEAAERAHEAGEAALNTADQLIKAHELVTQELERQLAVSEADRKLLREQIRVGDVAFQHLHCEVKGQPLPDWAKGWMNPREAEATKGMVAELEALLKQMKGSLAHEVMEAWQARCAKLEAEVKRLSAGWDEANGLALKNGLERQAALAACGQLRDGLELLLPPLRNLNFPGNSELAKAEAALSTEAGKGWASPEAMARERDLRQMAREAADRSVTQALHAVEDLLASAPLTRKQVDALIGYVNGYMERGVHGCWHSLATGICELIKHAHTLEASHAEMRTALDKCSDWLNGVPGMSEGQFSVINHARSTGAGEGWVSPAQLETIKQNVDRTLVKELEGAASGEQVRNWRQQLTEIREAHEAALASCRNEYTGRVRAQAEVETLQAQLAEVRTSAIGSEELDALRLKAADRDSWQEVALRVRGDLDHVQGSWEGMKAALEYIKAQAPYLVNAQTQAELALKNAVAVQDHLPLFVEQKRCAELERELERAKADRNKAGVEERHKYWPVIQAMGAALAKEREALAKFLVPWKHHLDASWLQHFEEAGSVQFDDIGYVTAVPVKWSVEPTVDKPSAAPEVLTQHEA